MTQTKSTNEKKRTPLSKKRLVAKALSIADAEGIGGLTMRKLATELGVKPMSIYYHVANKEEVIDAMVDAVFDEIDLGSIEGDWLVEARQRAELLRKSLNRHPWAVAFVNNRRQPGKATLAHHDWVIRGFREAGFTIAMTAHAFALIDSFVFGFVQTEVSLPFDGTEETHDVAEEIIEQSDMSEYPYLMELAMGHVMQPGYQFADEFTLGLDLILEGLALRKDL
jgi:AcrR family transcriptional regulator